MPPARIPQTTLNFRAEEVNEHKAGLPSWLVLENLLRTVLHRACKRGTTEEEATLQVPFLHRNWTWQQGWNDCPPACIITCARQLRTPVPDYLGVRVCSSVALGLKARDRPHPKWRLESLLPWITDNAARHSLSKNLAGNVLVTRDC